MYIAQFAASPLRSCQGLLVRFVPTRLSFTPAIFTAPLWWCCSSSISALERSIEEIELSERSVESEEKQPLGKRLFDIYDFVSTLKIKPSAPTSACTKALSRRISSTRLYHCGFALPPRQWPVSLSVTRSAVLRRRQLLTRYHSPSRALLPALMACCALHCSP